MAEGGSGGFSGDHADLEGVGSGDHHSKTTLDNFTIKKNSNGDAQNVRKETRIGKFENGKDGWTFTEDAKRDTSYSYEGIVSANLQYFSDGIFQDFDLTGKTELIIYSTTDVSSNINSDVKIDGTVVETIESGQSGTFQKNVVDISNYSGTKTVKLENPGGSDDIWVDAIRLVKPESLNITEDGSNIS